MLWSVRDRGEGHRASGLWLAAGYAGMTGFFVLEATSRRGEGTSSLDASGDDRGTTRMIVGAYALATSLAPVLRRSGLLPLPRGAAPAGLVLQAVGLGTRWWSMRTLGSSYSRTLRTETGQSVVDTGPYRLVRHPGYAGSLLIWTGFALTSSSLPVVALVGALMGTAYHRRMAAEEELLRRELPHYDDYFARTKKLIPFVW